MNKGFGNSNQKNEFKEGHNAKLIFLLDVLGEPLPEIEDLAKLPRTVLDYLDKASADELRALLIEVVGRWDAITHESN